VTNELVVVLALAWLGGTLIGSVLAFFLLRWSTARYVERLVRDLGRLSRGRLP